MRAALYERLQQLPVAFHDRWPAGQLLSRAVSDLSTIRRFLVFGIVFLVVNSVTFVVGDRHPVDPVGQAGPRSSPPSPSH